MNKLNSLPQKTINEVKEVLKAYETCNVIIENGEYKVRTFSGIQLNTRDIKFICEISANEIYSENERILNYIEVFQAFPHNYEKEKNSFQVLKQYKKGEISLNELAIELNLIEEIRETQKEKNSIKSIMNIGSTDKLVDTMKNDGFILCDTKEIKNSDEQIYIFETICNDYKYITEITFQVNECDKNNIAKYINIIKINSYMDQ